MAVNDQHFIDFSLKAVTRQASDAELAELNALIAQRPELRSELDRLQADARLARKVLPLLDAMEASAGEVPGYARERLRTRVRALCGVKSAPAAATWDWRHAFQFMVRRPRLAWAAIILVLAAVPLSIVLLNQDRLMSGTRQNPVYELAMLDTLGPTRSAQAALPKPEDSLRQVYSQTNVQSFSSETGFKQWRDTWPADGSRPVVKVWYDREAGQVSVLCRANGKMAFEKQFPVGKESDLPATLASAQRFIQEHLGK